MSSVDDLIKKHDGFAKTLEAQEEKIDTLEQLAQALLAQEHYASDHIRSRCQGVLDRRDKVKQVLITVLKIHNVCSISIIYFRDPFTLMGVSPRCKNVFLYIAFVM